MKRRAVKIISCGFFGYLSLMVFFGICSNVSAQSDLGERERILFEQIEDVPSKEPPTVPLKPQWQYGGFIDLGYLLDFNHPSNQLFRSRGTAFHVDDVYLNMAGAYVKKQASELSRWGVELTVQAGKDSEVFGFSA